jgi:hypothetical protein
LVAAYSFKLIVSGCQLEIVGLQTKMRRWQPAARILLRLAAFTVLTTA